MPFELLLNLALLEVCLIAYFKNRVYLEIDICNHSQICLIPRVSDTPVCSKRRALNSMNVYALTRVNPYHDIYSIQICTPALLHVIFMII